MPNNFEVALTKCYFCNKDSDIIMNKILTTKAANAVKEMHGKVIGTNPCSECSEYMGQGIILVSISDDSDSEFAVAKKEQRIPNPYRTGGWIVVKDRYILSLADLLGQELVDSILKQRFCFIPDKVWNALNLPRMKED